MEYLDKEKHLIYLQEQLSCIKKEIEELKKDMIKRFIPKDNELYFYISDDGTVKSEYWTNSGADIYRHVTGNCYNSHAETRDNIRNNITRQKLKDLARELNKGQIIDWNDINQIKHYILFSHSENKLVFSTTRRQQVIDSIYCLEPMFLDIAKQRIGEENLMELYRGMYYGY